MEPRRTGKVPDPAPVAGEMDEKLEGKSFPSQNLVKSQKREKLGYY